MSVEITNTRASDFKSRRLEMQSDAKIRPMRGQAVIREIEMRKSIIVQLDNPEQTVHRGIILALGEPCFLSYESLDSPRVPWDCKVGDEVIFVWTHNEAAFTKRWPDGGKACWIEQAALLAVVESDG